MCGRREDGEGAEGVGEEEGFFEGELGVFLAFDGWGFGGGDGDGGDCCEG